MSCVLQRQQEIFWRAVARHADWFDWKNDFKVTSALREEIESNQSSKAKERKYKLKGKLRERDRERNAERLRTSVGGGKSVNRLDGGNVRKVDNWAEGSGLSEEQRTRLDRERERFAPATDFSYGKKGTVGVDFFDLIDTRLELLHREVVSINMTRLVVVGLVTIFTAKGLDKHLADYKESGMLHNDKLNKEGTNVREYSQVQQQVVFYRPMSCQSLDQVVQGVEQGIEIIKVDDEGDLELDEDKVQMRHWPRKLRHTHKGYDYDQRW
ncbi:hypothetical protein BY996DRAFT_6505805 [Phakopsora pachyrhizi]|nr:hypothetical protein BY996DRAFT_6505805 [Phakopsora pachyrhizi]